VCLPNAILSFVPCVSKANDPPLSNCSSNALGVLALVLTRMSSPRSKTSLVDSTVFRLPLSWPRLAVVPCPRLPLPSASVTGSGYLPLAVPQSDLVPPSMGPSSGVL
jgi:hypothetical protein